MASGNQSVPATLVAKKQPAGKRRKLLWRLVGVPTQIRRRFSEVAFRILNTC